MGVRCRVVSPTHSPITTHSVGLLADQPVTAHQSTHLEYHRPKLLAVWARMCVPGASIKRSVIERHAPEPTPTIPLLTAWVPSIQFTLGPRKTCSDGVAISGVGWEQHGMPQKLTWHQRVCWCRSNDQYKCVLGPRNGSSEEDSHCCHWITWHCDVTTST